MNAKEVIEKLVSQHKGKVGVAFKHLDEVFPTASVIKIAVMVEAFAQADEGKLKLTDPVTMAKEDKVPGAGVLQHLTAGLAIPLIDAINLMIILSDNTDTSWRLDNEAQVLIASVSRAVYETL